MLAGRAAAAAARSVNMTTVESAPVFLAARYAGGDGTTGGSIPCWSIAPPTPRLTRGLDPRDRVTIQNSASSRRSPSAAYLASWRAIGIRRPSICAAKSVPANTSADYLSKMLRTVKLDGADVTVVPMPAADMAAAMKRGDVVRFPAGNPAHRTMAARRRRSSSGRSVYRELFNLNTTAGTERSGEAASPVDVARLPRVAEVHARPADHGRFCRRASRAPGHHRHRVASPDSRRRCHPTLDVLVEEEPWWPPGRSVRRAPARNCKSG